MTAHKQRTIIIIVIMGFATLAFNHFGLPWSATLQTTDNATLQENIANHPLLYFQTIDINTASLNDLTAIPRIGPVLGQRIIDYRKTHGDFSKLEELLQVQGIGNKTLLHLRKFCHTAGKPT